MSTNLSMEVPGEIIERAVRDQINAAIAEKLGNPQVLIQKLVNSALTQKVNANGKRSSSSYDNKYEFMDVVAGEFIRGAAKEALQEYFSENKALIKEAVKKEVGRSPSKFAKVFVDGITKSLDASYSTIVDVTFKTNTDY